MKIRRFALIALAAGLTLTACSGSKQETPSAGGSAEVGTTNDINPQDVSKLQQGGNLRLALTEFPANFNQLHIDGNTGDVGAIDVKVTATDGSSAAASRGDIPKKPASNSSTGSRRKPP